MSADRAELTVLGRLGRTSFAGSLLFCLSTSATLMFGGHASATTDNCVGDYSTGDFSQWSLVHNAAYYGSGKEFKPSYSASIVMDESRGLAARYEVRAGDTLSRSSGGGERSEVMAGPSARGIEGDVMWYRFSTKFDTEFPQNHEELGFGFTNQFWGASGAGPPIAWTVGHKNGFWTLLVQPQQSPGAYLKRIAIFETPLNVGSWHDVVMQIGWSATDSSGWIKLWLNGVRQTLADGSMIYRGRTLIPGTRTVHYKEGYYRHQAAGTPPGVVFHTGFHCGPGELPS